MENYRIVLEVNLTELQTFRTALFASHIWETYMIELWLLSETSTMSSTISVRISTVVRYSFFVNDRCEIDLSAWQQQLENSYHKCSLGVTSLSVEPAHPRHVLSGFHGTHHPPSSMTSLCNEPFDLWSVGSLNPGERWTSPWRPNRPRISISAWQSLVPRNRKSNG